MSTLIFIVIIAGIAYLAFFNKPQHHTEAQLKQWFSTKLTEIAASLEQDIESDRNGEYPHAGKQSFNEQGEITYLLRDKNYARFDISDKNFLTPQDIITTHGYMTLAEKTQQLNLTILLEEKMVEGDGVDSFNELDEYIDDFPRYYTITISGW